MNRSVVTSVSTLGDHVSCVAGLSAGWLAYATMWKSRLAAKG